MIDHYAVVGNPVAHSKSPMIHGLFAEQNHQAMHYGKIEAPLDRFQQTVQAFFSQAGNKGLNITVPFKEQAWAICDIKSERAELAGAVNTLLLDTKNQLVGDNTDGVGLVKDLLDNHHVALKNKKILLVGAGGAVRGVLQPILKEMPEKVLICNRTPAKADALVSKFKHLGNIQSLPFAALTEVFDVVINGTSASLSGDLPAIGTQVIGRQTVVYDMMYGPEETVFNQWARQAGAAHTIDGLGMLVEQAAEAFFIWRGLRPETGRVMSKLRSL